MQQTEHRVDIIAFRSIWQGQLSQKLGCRFLSMMGKTLCVLDIGTITRKCVTQLVNHMLIVALDMHKHANTVYKERLTGT